MFSKNLEDSQNSSYKSELDKNNSRFLKDLPKKNGAFRPFLGGYQPTEEIDHSKIIPPKGGSGEQKTYPNIKK